MSNPLSVVIITKNEENFIEDSIRSANFANEVLVLDTNSVDKTCEIAKEFKCDLHGTNHKLHKIQRKEIS